MLNQFSDVLKVLLQVAQIITILWAVYKFTRKPHDTLADEVNKLKTENTEIKVEIKEIQKSLDASFEKHREQEKTNNVFKKVMLLFANFETAFCLHTDYHDTEDLIEIKKELQDYLTGK